MRKRAVALRRIVNLAIIGFEPGSKFSKILCRYRRVNIEDVRAIGHQADGVKISRKVRLGFRIQMPCNSLIGDCAEQHVVPIRR